MMKREMYLKHKKSYNSPVLTQLDILSLAINTMGTFQWPMEKDPMHSIIHKRVVYCSQTGVYCCPGRQYSPSCARDEPPPVNSWVWPLTFELWTSPGTGSWSDLTSRWQQRLDGADSALTWVLLLAVGLKAVQKHKAKKKKKCWQWFMCWQKPGVCVRKYATNHVADTELPLYTTLPQTQVLRGLNGVH